jgi:hypothetical protein
MDYLFSVQSGWRVLAAKFRAGDKPAGPRVRWQVVRFGPIPEAGVTNMIPTTQGRLRRSAPSGRHRASTKNMATRR